VTEPIRPRGRPTGMRRLLLGALLALVLAGCADTPDSPEPTTGTPSPTGPAETPALPTEPPVLPSETPRGPELTLTGEVAEGVEANCLVLQTDTGEYLLIGEATQDLPIGETVTVRGQPQPGMATTCQQGTPFEVTEVVE
jgi:hypothetical protein